MFKKTIEDFKCGHCGTLTQGSGYTNHCPNCLWSKHVDISPGDRAEKCAGLMEPIDLEAGKNDFILIHRCQKCGALSRCKTAKNDSIEALTKLSEALVKRKLF
jgi:rubrerythrin